jgi:DNA-binding transcriptional LysR family regulator
MSYIASLVAPGISHWHPFGACASFGVANMELRSPMKPVFLVRAGANGVGHGGCFHPLANLPDGMTMNIAQYIQDTREAGRNAAYTVIDMSRRRVAKHVLQARDARRPDAVPVCFSTRLDSYLRSNLKFKNLQLLVTLDELRHIGKAANYLNVSQPAISKTLAVFEEGLDIKLFERTTRGMEPTEAGACLIRFARKMLSELSSVRDELNDINQGRVTRISLGVLPAASLVMLPNFIAHIESKMEVANVTVREGTTDILLSMLRSGDVDFIISNLTGKSMGREFQTQLLYKDPVVVVVRKDHPLVSRPGLGWKEVAHYPMVLPPHFAITRMAIEEFLLHHKVNISRCYVESLSTLTNIGVIQGTDSTGFLSREVAEYFVKIGVVSILPLQLDLNIDVGIVWMTDRKLMPAQKSVIDLIKTMGFREIQETGNRCQETD